MTKEYPIGIQTFSEIIKNNYVYMDKTDLVWKLTHYAKYIFLSRPRRFGKSLLTTTLASYFRGEKELFEGLRMMELEKEWNEYPVIHLSLSMAKGQESAAALRDRLLLLLKPYKEEFGSDPEEKLHTTLTIKDYDRESDIYTLSMPNLEVRIGYADGLLPVYSGLEGENVQAGFALKFWRALKKQMLTWQCARCRHT